MIPCQVSMIAEICLCHAKICETVLRYKTTLQNSFKHQGLIGQFENFNKTLCLSPQILHKHCFCFLLGPLSQEKLETMLL